MLIILLLATSAPTLYAESAGKKGAAVFLCGLLLGGGAHVAENALSAMPAPPAPDPCRELGLDCRKNYTTPKHAQSFTTDTLVLHPGHCTRADGRAPFVVPEDIYVRARIFDAYITDCPPETCRARRTPAHAFDSSCDDAKECCTTEYYTNEYHVDPDAGYESPFKKLGCVLKLHGHQWGSWKSRLYWAARERLPALQYAIPLVATYLVPFISASD